MFANANFKMKKALKDLATAYFTKTSQKMSYCICLKLGIKTSL